MWLSVLGFLLKLIVTPFLWAWAGAQWARKRALQKTVRVKDDQLGEALNPPDRAAVVDRLRKHEF